MIIRKWNGTDTWAAQSVETDLRSLKTTNAKLGSTVEADYPFDTSYKLKAAHLPDFVYGGLKFVGTLDASSSNVNVSDLAQSEGWNITDSNYEQFLGYYFIVSGAGTFESQADGEFNDNGGWDDGVQHNNGEIDLEVGDWIVLTGWDSSTDTAQYSVINNTYAAATTTTAGVMSAADKTKLDGIASSANNYTHPTYDGDDINLDTGALTGATVISDLDFNITSDSQGHITDANATVNTRNLTLADLGYTGATNANNYVHPTYDGDDIDLDTGPLTGATVISDLDFNITSDTSGHITDANASYSTRTLTLGDLGYTAPGNGTHTVSGTTDQVSISTAGGAFTANKGTLTTTTVSLSYPVYYADTQAGLSTDSSVPENAIGFEY